MIKDWNGVGQYAHDPQRIILFKLFKVQHEKIIALNALYNFVPQVFKVHPGLEFLSRSKAASILQVLRECTLEPVAGLSSKKIKITIGAMKRFLNFRNDTAQMVIWLFASSSPGQISG
ncbi:hypothetical protein U716_13415 [Rhodobacter capsulatus B6]|nr:hypothetical protein U716_13415 [Rhodobacter capsulatus B6]